MIIPLAERNEDNENEIYIQKLLTLRIVGTVDGATI